MVFASNAHDLLRVIYNYASCKAGILPAVISASRSGVFTGVIYLIRPSVHLSVCCSPAAVMLHRLFELEIRTRPTKKNWRVQMRTSLGKRGWENVWILFRRKLARVGRGYLAVWLWWSFGCIFNQARVVVLHACVSFQGIRPT